MTFLNLVSFQYICLCGILNYADPTWDPTLLAMIPKTTKKFRKLKFHPLTFKSLTTSLVIKVVL